MDKYSVDRYKKLQQEFREWNVYFPEEQILDGTVGKFVDQISDCETDMKPRGYKEWFDTGMDPNIIYKWTSAGCWDVQTMKNFVKNNLHLEDAETILPGYEEPTGYLVDSGEITINQAKYMIEKFYDDQWVF